MTARGISTLFVAAVALRFVVQLWLIWRYHRTLGERRNAVPDVFANKVNLDEHRKAADYTQAKLKVAALEDVFSVLVLIAWTLGGGLQWLDHVTLQWSQSELVQGLLVFAGFMGISLLLDLPFSLYRTFRLEQHFGFNRTTVRTYIGDLVRKLILTIVLGTPFLAGILWFFLNLGDYWWAIAWAAWVTFSLALLWAFPRFIAPLFNKFQPLTDPKLQSRLSSLVQRAGFHARSIFVMDGSKRSAHGNAFFTGIGRNKRIVFFDTLIEQLSGVELEAVLAHELGHFKLHHVRKRMALTLGFGLIGFAILGFLSQWAPFFHGLGLNHPTAHGALLLFTLVSPAFSFFLLPIGNHLSRSDEFAADAFALSMVPGSSLADALVKLYKENATSLTPDPFYSLFYDSHPPAPLRIARMQQARS